MGTGAERLSIKPSVLLGKSISRAAGITYQRTLLDESEKGGTESRRWETLRVIPNVDEFKASGALVAECNRALMKVCVKTAVGLLCSKDNEKALDDTVAEIRSMIETANETYATVRISAAFVKGVIESSDDEAAKAITQDIQGFLANLYDAIEKCDVKKIRQTVLSMKGIDTLLPSVESEKIKAAMMAAKKVAKTIVAEVEKKGREITEVKQEFDLSEIDVARIAFVEIAPTAAAMAAEPPAPDIVEASERMQGVEVA